MLLLLFEIGKGRYALDINQIVEITPLVHLKTIPTTPDYVAGLMNYRGEGIPVIDLNQLLESTAFKDLLSTRIIIINYPFTGRQPELLALIAHNVTETVRSDLNRPPPTGVLMDKTLYEGGILPETGEMIQWFDAGKMVPEKEICFLYEEVETF